MIAFAVAAFAQAPVDSEGTRIVESLQLMARNGTWAGVEAKYVELIEDHPRALSGAIHLLGAEAARVRGELLLAAQRYQRVQPTDPAHAEAAAALDLLERGTRLVALENPGGGALVAKFPPFDPVMRAAVDLAAAEVADGGWVGLLPMGSYTLADHPVQVGAGFTWQVVRPPDP